MSNNFFGEVEDFSYCVECGKKIKAGHYYLGRGPYGICCYKKLYGTAGLIIKRKRSFIIPKKIVAQEGETCPVTGTIKECGKCLFFDDCQYK